MIMVVFLFLGASDLAAAHMGEQALSKIAIHRVSLALRDSSSIKASPFVLGLKVMYLRLIGIVSDVSVQYSLTSYIF